MQQLAVQEKIEAYILPGGVSSQLMREIGAGRPACSPTWAWARSATRARAGPHERQAARDDLAEVVQMDGREYLRYKPFPIHVALVRASAADEDGNISFEHEAANLDAQSLALAARNSGGRVIVQVKERCRAAHSRHARCAFRPPGSTRLWWTPTSAPATTSRSIPPQRRADRRRARLRGRRPCGRAGRASEASASARRWPAARPWSSSTPARRARWSTTAWVCPTRWPNWWWPAASSTASTRPSNTAPMAALLMDGVLFGYARNASAMLDAPTQFDFYAGGGLDIAFLGFGEMDAQGNVNVSASSAA
jgi:propionate CoA-transferase